MPRIVIREVNIGDTLVKQAVASLIADVFDKDTLTHPYVPQPGHWWIAFDGKTAAAFAGIRASSRDAGYGYLCLAGVLPEYRGLGLQQRLIKTRCRKAKSLGWTHVVTEVISDNPHSMANLIRCGFKPYTPTVLWGDPAAVYWRKQL